MRECIVGFLLAVAGVGVGLEARGAPDAAPPSVLFHAHFNQAVTPATADLRGDVAASNCGITSGGLGYPFTDSSPAAEGLDMRRRAARIEFPVSEHSFDPAEGTVELWYKYTNREDLTTGAMTLFRVVFEGTKGPEHRWDEGDNFALYKHDMEPVLGFRGQSSARGVSWKAMPRASVADWRRDDWHFITLTWREGIATIYLDGKRAGEGRYVPAASKARGIVLGSSFWGLDPEGIFDELRVLAHAAAPEAVLRHYEHVAVERLEFGPAGDAAVTAAKTPAQPPPLVEPYAPIEQPPAPAAGLELLDVAFTAVRATRAPAIDGRLGDPGWASAPEATGFVRRGDAGAKAKGVEAQTHARFLYDDRFLYLGVRMDEPRMPLLRREVVDQHDQPVWRDDCLEFVFDTSGSPDTFYHFAVNANGTIADLRASRLNWSSRKSVAATSQGPDHWTVELAISLGDLGVAPKYGEIWGARVCRERYAVPKGASAEQSSLPDIGRAGFHTYGNLGQLRFGPVDGQRRSVRVEPADEQRPFLGMNRLTYRIANGGKGPANLVFEARATGDANMLLAVDRRRVDVPAGGSNHVTLDVPVQSDALQAISVTASDGSSGRTVYATRLRSSIPRAGPGLDEFREQLPRLQACMGLLPEQSTVTLVLRESVDRIAEHLTGFEEKLAAAVATGRVLEEDTWLAFRRELGGFGQWLGKHRVVAWNDELWRERLPTSFPDERQELRDLSIGMAANEWEATAFCLTGLAVPGRLDVQVVVNDLVCETDKGRRLSRNNVRVHWEAPFRDELRKLVSDPLIRVDGNVFTVTTGRTLKLWVMVCSAGVLPGTYSGEVVVRPLDTLEAPPDRWLRIPLEVEVWPFELPETKDNPLEAFMWGGSAYHRVDLDPIELTRDLDEHRVNWVMADWYQAAGRSSRKRKGVFAREDLERCRALFDQAKLRGMKVMFAWNSPTAESVGPVVEYMRGLGFGDADFASMSTKDEFGSQHVAKMLEYHRRVEELGTPMRFMCTYCSQSPPYGATHDEIQPMMNYIDIWLNHAGLWWPPNEKGRSLFARQRERGATVGAYQCASPMRTAPLLDYFRLYPWKAWKMGVKMVAYWTYLGATRGDSDFWDVHYSKGYRGHGPSGMVYVSAGNRLTPSRRYEAFREGMEDVCYLWTLQRRIAAAKAEGREVADAERLLEETVDKALAAQAICELDAVRAVLARAIIGLAPAE